VHHTWCKDEYINHEERIPSFSLVNVDYNIDNAHAHAEQHEDDYDGYMDYDGDAIEGYADG
jgi:hypothetical protein